MTTHITHLEREILEQPDCLARLLRGARDAVVEIAAAVRRFDPAFVVTAARGSSDNAARYAKYLLGVRHRLVVSLGAPSLVTLYGAAPDLARALVIGISQSGESPDIVALLAEGRRQGALTVAITNRYGSPLAAAAHHTVDLDLGTEQSVVASKSYTGQLMALAMLSAALSGDPADWDQLAEVPEAARQTLAINRSANTADGQAAGLGSLADAQRLVVLGRGFHFATAFEAALKLKETAYLMAEPLAAPDLFHGPLAMLEAGFPALVIAPSGVTLPSMNAAMDALQARGAEILAISDDAAVLDRPGLRLALPLPSGGPEWLSPLVAVLPAQLCALRLAQLRNLDPDRPRGLSKITRTR